MNCKDCGTELLTLAAQSAGRCNRCDGKHRDAQKAAVLDTEDRLEQLEQVVRVLVHSHGFSGVPVLRDFMEKTK
jgi:hypothetical protein